MNLKSLIRDVPDFPSAGILFRDISPLLKNPEAMDLVAHKLVEQMDLSNVDYFAGIESRGFILAMLLAATFKKGFMPIRKAGKLPPPVLKVDYTLEYGNASIELPPGQGRIAIIDDVLATGGTLNAAIDLSQLAGYQVEHVAVLINLKFLNELKFRGKEVPSVIEY
ncbi:MAG: adenine phosphoribosyltransferase [Bdellovibrionaceae bacterium]|nr:adenine phosphoribosyltransferase [Pseudobdellovibrionaceae bacterium]